MPEYKDSKGFKRNEKGELVRTITPTIYVGDGTLENGEKIELLTTWGQSPVIRFEDSSEVAWGWNELINEAIKIKEQKQEPVSSANDTSH